MQFPSKKNTYYGHPQLGIIGIIRYQFESELVISDKDDKVIKVFKLHDKHPLKTVFHPDFLKESTIADSKAEILAHNGFPTEGILETAYGAINTKTRNHVYTRIEYNTLHADIETAKLLLAASYGEQKLIRPLQIVSVHEKQKAIYPEIAKETEDFATLIQQYMAHPNQPEIHEALASSGKNFSERSQSASASKSIKQIYGANSAIAYLLTKNIEQAAQIYKDIELTWGLFSKSRMAFYANFSIFNARKIATEDSLSIDCSIPLGVEDRIDYLALLQEDSVLLAKKMVDEAESQRLSAHNVEKVPGKILTRRGDTYEGNICMYFLRLPNHSPEIKYSTVAYVFFDGYEGGMTISCQNIKHVIVGDRFFEPVSEHNIANSRFEKLLFGNEWTSTILLEKVYEKNEYSLYRDWSHHEDEIYLIKHQMSPTAHLYHDVLSLTGPTAFYYENRPEIQERIKNQEFKRGSFEDAKKLIDLLAQ